MNFKIGFFIFVGLLAVVVGKFLISEKDAGKEDLHAQTKESSSSTAKLSVVLDSISSFSSSSSSQSNEQSRSYSAISSINSLSGSRVEPLPEIVNFLRQMDSVVIPKIYLPTPQRDPNFDYKNSEPAELKDKGFNGDPYAAYAYAEYIVKTGVRTTTDSGAYAYNIDDNKRIAAMAEAREFYIRAFRGGIVSAADVLSRLYVNSRRSSYRVESLAWRKVSFAVGESERYECLRNSETCVVKDFNNLNRVEFFYPCLSSARDSCAQSDYDSAMKLALLYADSLEFALNNKVPR